ncbi:MAG: alpha/beta hydrolase [Planctomycetota bacterium]
MRSERVQFQNRDGLTLAARLEEPDGADAPRGTAVFAHCFTCSKDIPAAARIARGLSDRGFSVLRFDFTGLGSSDGDFANTNFSSNVQDLEDAAAFMAERGHPPSLLVGHSLGGAAVLAAAPRIDGVEAVVTIGAPADPRHVVENFAASLDEIESIGSAEVQLAGRSFTIKKQFLDDLEARASGGAGDLDAALLVMHAPGDAQVSIDEATRIYTSHKGYRSFVTLADADHLLTRKEDADYAAEVIAAWSSRYLRD